jgi:hypothetical protein
VYKSLRVYREIVCIDVAEDPPKNSVGRKGLILWFEELHNNVKDNSKVLLKHIRTHNDVVFNT